MIPRPRPKVVRKAATFARNAMGVTKIKRDGYSTVNGFSRDNEWWSVSAAVRRRSGGYCEDRRHGVNKVRGTDVHHIVPLGVRGGRTVLSNLIHLCDACHERRHPGNHKLKAHHAAKR
jgi:hypothetical protein